MKKLFLALSAVGVWAEEDAPSSAAARYGGIHDALNPSLSSTGLIVFALIVLALIVLVVAYEIIKTEKIKKIQLDAQWKSFEKATKERGITPSLMALLRKIMENSERHTPEMALQSPRVYELALEAYVQKNKSLQHNLEHPEYAQLRKLRLALGYDIIHPEMPYVSTRQFRLGDEVNLKIKLKSTGEESNHPHPAVVCGIDEACWEISYGGGVPEGDSELKMSYTRPGDADYLLQVPVLSVQKGMLVLGHTTQLMRKQQRNWVRWATEIPVLIKGKIRRGDKEVFEEFEAMSSDISGGGISLTCTHKIEGKFVTLQFTLPPSRAFREVNAEIVRKAVLPGTQNLTRYSLYFSEMKEEEREHIVRYIFDQQRQIAKERPI